MNDPEHTSISSFAFVHDIVFSYAPYLRLVEEEIWIFDGNLTGSEMQGDK